VEHTTRPDDFDQYWDVVDHELSQYPAAPALELLPLRRTDFATVYGVKLTSIGPYRIFGYYSVPNGPGPFPGLLVTPKYGSVNHLPHYDDRERYAVLVLMHRGQRLADQPFAASYPGLLTHGIESPETYIYRGIVADCLRGAEFLAGRPEVDATRIGITGDDLALITAARRPIFSAAQAAGLMFYRLMDTRQSSTAYPIEEVNDYLRTFPDREAAVTHTLSYLDPVQHASRITAGTLISLGSGARSGVEWHARLLEQLSDRGETYELTHEGATDHDWTDAWLAERLGVEPKPRLWTVEEPAQAQG
jgi:cephalosporin-C deacetylase